MPKRKLLSNAFLHAHDAWPKPGFPLISLTELDEEISKLSAEERAALIDKLEAALEMIKQWDEGDSKNA